MAVYMDAEMLMKNNPDFCTEHLVCTLCMKLPGKAGRQEEEAEQTYF